MADNNMTKAPTPKVSRQPAPTTVTPIKSARRLPEPYVRVEDEILPPQMESRGLDPLHRVRGMTERAATAVGIDVPKAKE